jgi:hypothetical protein
MQYQIGENSLAFSLLKAWRSLTGYSYVQISEQPDAQAVATLRRRLHPVIPSTSTGATLHSPPDPFGVEPLLVTNHTVLIANAVSCGVTFPIVYPSLTACPHVW